MANIIDVAKHAGVSVATVSRYFSSPDKVAKKSADKVAASVQALNYTPNLLARNFSQSRSYAVMVVVPDVTSPFLAQLIRGIEQAGSVLGYQFILSDMKATGVDYDSYYEIPESRLIDGMIQLAAKFPNDIKERQAKCPVVLLCDCDESVSVHNVAVDDFSATTGLVEYLISLGHKKIACLKGGDIAKATFNRLLAYNSALDDANLDYRYVVEGKYDFKSGFLAAQEIVSQKELPTAVVCMDDTMAIGLIKGLKNQGLKVPEDISVTGFDDIPFSPYCDPPLTTVSQPAHQLGTTAMELLVRLIENPEERTGPVISYRLPSEIVIRDSTAKAPEK